jgi:hypothetical protein
MWTEAKVVLLTPSLCLIKISNKYLALGYSPKEDRVLARFTRHWLKTSINTFPIPANIFFGQKGILFDLLPKPPQCDGRPSQADAVPFREAIAVMQYVHLGLRGLILQRPTSQVTGLKCHERLRAPSGYLPAIAKKPRNKEMRRRIAWLHSIKLFLVIA